MTTTSPDHVARPGLRQQVKRGLRLSRNISQALATRLGASLGRTPRFAGVYASRAEATVAAAKTDSLGYERPEATDISFALMCQRQPWDYPVIYWLSRLLPETGALIDAGGNRGTKYMAFADLLDLGGVAWTVYDLPGVIRTARTQQAEGRLPAAIHFKDRLEALPASDLLLGSGLLQYLDIPFPILLARLPHKPRHILLNKVALRDGPGFFTLESAGPARIPYQIRNREVWLSEIAALGYRIRDSWRIPDLGHVIPTHPWHGRSESWGFVLELG